MSSFKLAENVVEFAEGGRAFSSQKWCNPSVQSVNFASKMRTKCLIRNRMLDPTIQFQHFGTQHVHKQFTRPRPGPA